MKKFWIVLFGSLLSLTISCGSDDNSGNSDDGPITEEDSFIRGVDMSSLPEIEAEGYAYKNAAGQTEDALATLKNAGVNTIRIRLWKNPANGHSGMAEVKTLAQRVKAAGMKVWLTVHYSDTWADPGHQETPAEWAGLNLQQLTDQAMLYTANILAEIDPDIFQIGNETNTGFMYPLGNVASNEAGYLQLVNGISATIRQNAPDTKIMIHYAGIADSADWFFNKVADVDYDYIGLSYYPIWHGKSIANLQIKMQQLGAAHNKKVVIAETAYPFTLDWSDWTNNVVGQDDQLIPAYPASAEGQKSYMMAIRSVGKNGGIGFCYWGAEWTAFRGPEAPNGSTWENQALWDFDGKALPAMEAFYKE
ncbi:arabinogalactan endo-1,4-beta-galactosidase [Flavobacterium sp. MFBS3-15]|uniref:glycoside hydrolase family 53 protein n=1 Tax=Flavobacterium sp. MFBS3-15 TaxID=2989816 RepID=UPI0022367232|nr:arabinogalactan endo-1,4-beta-galactosidase [Flavobacterium sp. MFBS3-15]MCW4468565.1 arabinogalactan endo-1,4-beta-galactosidase [Flavobacterium sp. MFBS3-15]